MGQDLLLARVQWPIGMDGQEIPRDRLLTRLRADIAVLDTDTASEVYMDLRGEEPGEWRDIADCRNCGTPISAPSGKGEWEHDQEAPESSGCWSGAQGPEPDDQGVDTVYRAFEGVSGTWEAEVRLRLQQAVDDIFGDRADVEVLEQPNARSLIVAGGSSYGDDPNVEFRSLSILDIAGLLKDERPLSRLGVYVLSGHENGWPTVAIGPFDDRITAAAYATGAAGLSTDEFVTITDDPRLLPIEAPA